MKVVLVVLILMSSLLACGKLGTVEHEGTINAKVSIDEEQLRHYFGNYCKRQLEEQLGLEPTAEQLDACTDAWVADFLAAVTSQIKPSPVPVNF